MNIRLLIVSVCAVILAGCSALQNPSKRTVPVLTDFSNPTANHAYYEFSSSPLDKPSVLSETEEAEAEIPEETLGDDEDFSR